MNKDLVSLGLLSASVICPSIHSLSLNTSLRRPWSEEDEDDYSNITGIKELTIDYLRPEQGFGKLLSSCAEATSGSCLLAQQQARLAAYEQQ